ncbi:MAG: hypothetical protein SVM80_09905 [Halobacteriota archaeon]|nr:hypothetical protein [Halobacteriota archaeon]
MLYWDPVTDFAILSLLLLIATLIRVKSEFIQKLLIPNALLAGSIGLVLRLLLERYQGVTLIDTDLGTAYVYHLLNLSFAAIALTAPIRFWSIPKIKGAASTGLYMSFMLVLQSFVGFGIVLLLINTIYPDLFPGFGFMMAWGYALGPGQAASIGGGLESVGFDQGASIGLIFGAIGFAWSCLVGVPLIHWGIRRGISSFVKSPEEIKGLSGVLTREEKRQSAGRLTTSSEAIDTLTLQLALCGLVYLLAYGLVYGMSISAEMRGSESPGVVWGFVFFITALIGVQIRSVMDRMKIGHVIDPGLQTRISGTCVDYLVTAAIVIIPLTTVIEYAVPILLVSTAGGIVTLLTTVWLARRIWDNYQFERMVLCYGTLTGTIGTGMALLRVVDPRHRSQAAIHYALGMWLALIFMAPILIVENLTIGRNYLTLMIFFIYICILFFMWRLLKLWNPVKPYTSFWPEDE